MLNHGRLSFCWYPIQFILQQLCIILHTEELTQKTMQRVKPEVSDSDSDFEEARWRKQLKLHSDCVEVPSNRSVLFFINCSRVLYDVCAFLCRSPIRVDLMKEGADNTVRCFCGCLYL